MEQTHNYYFDFKSIMNVKENITPEEESMAKKYLRDLVVEKDEDDKLFPMTAETLRYLIVHIVRNHENFTV